MAFTKGIANFTNGSKVVTSVSLTSGQLAYFASGTAVFVQSEGQLIEATGLPKDGNGDVIPNQFLLRGNWTGTTGSYEFVAFDTIEGLRDAVQSARGFSEQLQSALTGFDIEPTADSFAKRTSTGAIKSAPGENANESLVVSQASVAASADKIVKRTADGKVKAANATETDEAVTLGQTGSAYNKNVQDSLTDNTPGRLMSVGAFGVGATIPETTSWDTVEYSGFNNASLEGIFHSGMTSTNGRLQLVSRDGNLKYRDRINSANWYDVYNQSNIIGPVSQSDGFPTGAIIEHDSNSDGYYTKYADGTVEVFGNFLIDNLSGSIALYGDVTLPAPVISGNDGDARTVTLTLMDSAGQLSAISGAMFQYYLSGANSSTNCRMGLAKGSAGWGANQRDAGIRLNYHLIGRWY